MTPQPPELDRRDDAAVLAELLERRPGYLPGWRPQPGGAGETMLGVLAHFAGLLTDGLRRVPERDLLAFLDAMGIELLPPRAARAPVVFRLAGDAPLDIALPAGTEIAAAVTPPLPSSLTGHRSPTSPEAADGPVPFATDLGITLARARLASVHSIVPAADAMADHTASIATGFTWFDQGALEQVPHHLYLGHGTLFDRPEAAEVSLHVSQTQLPAGGAARPDAAAPPARTGLRLRWEYLTGEGWLAFEPVIDQTRSLTADGEVVLRKVCGAPTVRAAVGGAESFWIRARVDQALPAPGSGELDRVLPRLDTIRARVALSKAGIPMDASLADGVPVDTSKEFLPFGPEPRVGSTLLLACDDAFARVGAEITLTFTLSPASDADGSNDLELTWEHSTGDGTWSRTFSGSGDTLEGKATGAGSRPLRTVSFLRPDDWRPAVVDGDRHHWLRIRVTAGGYGGPISYKTQRTTPTGEGETWKVVPDNQPRPPLLAGIAATYAFRTGPTVPQHCLTLNRFSYADHTDACRWGRQPFRPFEPVADREAAAYLGFDQPLPVGLVSLYVDVAGVAASVAGPSAPFVWEYRSPTGWSELSLRDESDGFRQSGMLQLVGPADHLPDDGPTGPLYWLRARSKTQAARPQELPVGGLHLNAVWATERRSVRGEDLGSSDGAPGMAMAAQHAPILPRERLEVEEWHGAGREWESLFADVPPAALRYDRNADGAVTAVWVTWRERGHLHGSGPQDRDYTVERTRGLFRFGDGEAGRIPPPGARLVVSYDYGGGVGGNVAAGEISQLNSAVPYVEQVTNPAPAGGGAQAETVAAVRARGPQRLRNRGRALAAADYEWLAREATAEVAVARCLPAMGPVGAGQAGWVTVVVAPWSTLPRPQPSRELLSRVRAYLAERAPAAVGRTVRVTEPAYTPVSVLAEVVVSDSGRTAEVEQELRAALDAFLHPLTGGPRQAGWRFGQPVHLSQVAAVIEHADGIDHAVSVQLAVAGAVHGERVPIAPERLPAAGRHLLKLRLGGTP